MSIPLQIIIGIAVGLVLGEFNYSMLWLTVSRLAQSRHPGLLAMLSFFIRMAVLLVVFYFLAIKAGWLSILAGLAGMILVRIFLIRKFQPESDHRPQKEIGRL